MKTFIGGVAVGVAVAMLIAAGLHLLHRADPTSSVPAAQAPELKHQKTESVAIGTIEAYPARAKKDLGLPPDVQADTDRHVVAAAKTDARHPQTVTAVTDEKTGQTSLYIRTDPLPWFRPEQTGEATFSRGFSDAGLVYRLTAREDFLQIKAAHLGVTGSMDSNGRWFAGVGLRVVW